MAVERIDKATVKEAVCRFCGITDEQHSQVVYNTGLKWLKWRFGGVPEYCRRWEDSSVFWQWWKRQWDMRDELLCNKYGIHQDTGRVTKAHIRAFREIYDELHGIQAMKIYPAQPTARKINEECKNNHK
ncbi:MAG: hypothetical protein H6606_05915 [Flavobacteriales bacterium]|nr:hypothetical protein [Flavobacteriales bacterium]